MADPSRTEPGPTPAPVREARAYKPALRLDSLTPEIAEDAFDELTRLAGGAAWPLALSTGPLFISPNATPATSSLVTYVSLSCARSLRLFEAAIFPSSARLGGKFVVPMTNAYAPDPATKLQIYGLMSLIKQNDEHARRAIRTGRLVMNYYSPRGQECIPAAVSVSLDPEDYICTIYRGLHDMVAKGVPLKPLWAEFAGRVDGTCKGKGGPMHITHPASGCMVTTGIVGSSMPIANGLAWSAKLSGSKRVTVAYFGDGASNIGAFHESLNLASIWKLPVIFVCQNNQYSEHTPIEKCTAIDEIARRADSYSMPGVRVNGNDPVEVYAAAREAIDRARAGEGPTLIEAVTFRFFGHNMGDDDSYMPKDKKQAALERDPFPLYRRRIIDEGVATEAELEAIDQAHERDVREALEFALASPPPEIAELHRDVYAQEVNQ